MEFFLIWILFGIATSIVASNKGKDGCGWFILGCLLGPFGLIFALVGKADQQQLDSQAISVGQMRKCPDCAELVRAEARKCRFCGAVFGDQGASSSINVSEPMPEQGASEEMFDETPASQYEPQPRRGLVVILVLVFVAAVAMGLKALFSPPDEQDSRAVLGTPADRMSTATEDGAAPPANADRALPNSRRVDFNRPLSPDAEVLASDLEGLGLSETEARAFATYCDQNRSDPICQ